jgi:hypothetical protein
MKDYRRHWISREKTSSFVLDFLVCFRSPFNFPNKKTEAQPSYLIISQDKEKGSSYFLHNRKRGFQDDYSTRFWKDVFWEQKPLESLSLYFFTFCLSSMQRIRFYLCGTWSKHSSRETVSLGHVNEIISETQGMCDEETRNSRSTENTNRARFEFETRTRHEHEDDTISVSRFVSLIHTKCHTIFSHRRFFFFLSTFYFCLQCKTYKCKRCRREKEPSSTKWCKKTWFEKRLPLFSWSIKGVRAGDFTQFLAKWVYIYRRTKVMKSFTIQGLMMCRSKGWLSQDDVYKYVCKKSVISTEEALRMR